jgi:hypothetical protein
MTTPKAANDQPLPVTVLVPTYNRADYLPEALASLLAQDREPAEIVVIDDGSETDAAEQVVKSFGGRVGYLRQENMGKSAALNLGLASTRQPFVWVFDDDDIAEPDALSSLYAALEANPDAGFAYGLCDKFTGAWPAPVSEANTAYWSDNRRALYVRLLEDFFMWQGAMLVRRSAYDAAGPFDVRMARSQDYEMNLRLTRRFIGAGVPKVMFHQRHHDGVRGPRAAQVKADAVESAWRRYNQLIFSEIHVSHDLDEFHADPAHGEAGDRRRITALIQRGCIMARRGLWPQATRDFDEAAALCGGGALSTLNSQEVAALRRVFQPGARSTFADAAEARAFGHALRGFADAELTARIRGNLLLPVSHRIKQLVRRQPAPRGETRQILMILSHLAGPGAMMEYFKARREALLMYGVQPLDAPAAAGV